MMTPVPICSPVATGSVPYNLLLWVDEHSLRQEVRTTIASVADANFAPNLVYGYLKNIRPQGLLSLLVYAYATGTFSSQDIQRQLETDPGLRELLPENPVDPLTLRVFRRRWRQLIKQCLVVLFQRVWAEHYSDQSWLRTKSSEDCPQWIGCSGDPRLIKDFLCEAESRILRAILYDTMEADV
jgi:hypothetical protein